MIPRSFIQDLLSRVDIVAVVERYVPLKRAGANFVACCPFHSEKSPSFTVSQSKQFYHCFGCGAHGTAIGFVMEYTASGFVDAVKDLAQSVGMQVPEIKGERAQTKTDEGDDLYAVLLKAVQYYRAQLKSAPQAIAYLKKRGLSGEIAKRFGIGYAPNGWQNLQAAFPDYNANALAAAGLVIQGEGGKRYDRFRDRIMFPIVDQRGQIIGFGGRILGSGDPKYLNSPETPLFEKGRELYGLYQARRAIRDTGRVVVVEGYMDVVALAQHAIGYAVATLGTATTSFHVQKLMRQAQEIVFCFDGDDAGRRAAWRALENSLEQLADGKQLSFLFLPQGEDPDSYVRKLEREQFEKLLDDATPLSKFMLTELAARTDLKTAEGRARLLQEARPYIKKVAAPLLSLMLRKQLAQLAGVSQEELDTQFQVKTAVRSAVPRKRPPPQPSIVRSLLEVLMLHPQLAGQVDRAALEPAYGVSSIDKAELAALTAILDAVGGSASSVSNWPEYFRGTEHEEIVSQIASGMLSRDVEMGRDEAESVFNGGWTQLLNQIRIALAHALIEKANNQPLTKDDEVLLRTLSKPLTAAAK